MALEFVARAAHLALLALYPGAFWAEPTPTPSGGVIALSSIALLAPIGLGVLLYRRVRTAEALAQAISWPVTVAVLLIGASQYSGADGPLLRGYYLAGAFLWLSLALTGSTLAGAFLGTRFKNRKVFGALAVLTIGIILFRSSYDYLTTTSSWAAVVKRQPASVVAIEQLVGDPRDADAPRPDRRLDACIAKEPSSCVCLTRRAALKLRLHDTTAANDVIAARDARCPEDRGSLPLRAIAADVFARAGEPDLAEVELAAAPDRTTNKHLVYVDAVVHALRGDAEGSEALVKQAIELGAGRDARLQYVALLMQRKANDEARPILQDLVKRDPADGDVLYNLALLDDYAGQFNKAREGYLATLAADPTQRNARYNLAVLTLRQGITKEAQHHAQKFVESFPDDPRGAELLRLVGANSGSQ